MRGTERDRHIDIFVRDEGRAAGIELKYKTRWLCTTDRGEPYLLKDQAAQDLGRYDFFKDVQRLEEFVSCGAAESGLAVFLTNDSAYWKAPQSPAVSYADFVMTEGRSVSGQMSWGATAGPGTTKGREAPVSLTGSYFLEWHEYSNVGAGQGAYPRFRYLMICV